MQRATHYTRHAGDTAPSVAQRALAARRLGALNVARFELHSTQLRDGEPLPYRSTADGDGVPPPLAWEPLEPAPASYALICEDPDAPRATPFIHWLVYGIPGNAQALDANLNGCRQGLNGHGEVGFAPAAPPPGHQKHHYHFQLFALDVDPHLPDGIDCGRLLDALSDHVMA